MASNSVLNARTYRTARLTSVKVAVHELIKIFRDNWTDLIECELSDQFTAATYKNLQWLTTQELNILKRVIKELSTIYKTPAERQALIESEVEKEGVKTLEKQADEAYDNVMQESNIDFVMPATNNYTNLINHTVVKAVWRDSRMEYDLLNFDNVEVFTDPVDWMRIVAVKYYIGLKLPEVQDMKVSKNTKQVGVPNDYDITTNELQDYAQARVYTFDDISAEGIIENGQATRLEAGKIYHIQPNGNDEKIIMTEDNPYKDEDGKPLNPFVIFDKEYPVGERFDFSTGNDLRDLNINIALLLVYINSAEKYQSFKQIVAIVKDKKNIPNPLRLDPAAALILEGDEGFTPSVNTMDLQLDIKQKIENLKDRIFNCLAGYGISPENFQMSASPQSGFALKISNIGKLEAREAQIPQYRRGERKLFDVTRIINNAHNTEQISMSAKFSIDFADPDFPMSPDEKIKKDEFELKHNIKTDIDLIKEDNPDLTDEQAERKYRENKAVNEANKPIIGLAPIQQPGGNNGMQDNEEEEG